MKTYYGAEMDADFPDESHWKPRYNIAPTQIVPVVVREEKGKLKLKTMRWGLVPFWAKELAIGSRMINARAETLAEKPAFREALKKRRCLVPVDGFYEWQARADGPKQPFRIQVTDSDLFSFAGLWESWKHPATQKVIETFTIITTEANSAMRKVHDRMPVILSAETEKEWLEDDTGRNAKKTSACLKPAPSKRITMYRVSTAVNSPRNDVPRLIEPIEPLERMAE
jgi:putative SOS response-associated peptidase YedK